MKKHGNQKYERKADSTLSLRCNAEDKANWQIKAKASSQTLNEWVIFKLNNQNKVES